MSFVSPASLLEPAVVLLGAILLIVCLVLGAGIVLSNSDPITADAFGVSLSGLTLGELLLGGIVLGALAVVGLGMILSGAARKRRKHTAHKREVRSARDEQETLAERNARLEAELGRERSSAYPSDGLTGDTTRQRS